MLKILPAMQWMPHTNKWTLLVLGFVLLSACARKIGDLGVVQPPVTKLFVQEINRLDTNGFSGRIRLYWFGESATGYITGYEVRHDTSGCSIQTTAPWFPTNRTDSAFLFRLPPGRLTAKIAFSVRAIDNRGLKDVSPPCVDVPVKNAVPRLNILKPYLVNKALPDTVFSAFTIRVEVTDEDGLADLDSVAIQLNNGTWVSLPPGTLVVTLIPARPESLGSEKTILKIGNKATVFPVSPSVDFNLNVGGFNTVKMRVKDASGTWSKTDSTHAFYIRPKKSDLLMLRSFIPNSRDDLSIYDTLIRNTYTAGYDLYDVNVNGKVHLPKEWNLSFYEMLKLYDKVFVSAFTQKTPNEINAFIENASLTLFSYLNAGGKVWVSVSALPDDPNSTLYQFFPFDSISTSFGQARITSSIPALPDTEYASDLSELRTRGLLTGATPGYLKQGSTALYTVNYTSNDGWTGPNVLAGASKGLNGKINLIVFSSDLYKFSGNPEGLKKLTSFVLNQQFAP